MTDRQVNVIPVREKQPLVLNKDAEGTTVTRRASRESRVSTEQRVSGRCRHMHPERTVSLRPDARKVLLLAHAQRAWGGRVKGWWCGRWGYQWEHM